MTAPAADDAALKQEVEALHAFFEGWFGGTLPASDESFARFDSVIAPGFVIVSPRGVATPRSALVTELRAAHGMWAHREGGRIWIEDLEVHHREADVAIVTYQEWQRVDDETRGRLSTAVLQSTLAGIRWLHVHETWLPDAEDPAGP